MNTKKKGIILLWVSIFVIFTSLIFFVIGCNSDYLVGNMSKRFALMFLILAIILLAYSIFLIIRFRLSNAFKKGKMIAISIIVAIYALGCSSFLFVLYGPNDTFRTWLITTAMTTMNHQYYCKWFYSDEMINEVLSQNYVSEGDESTDTSLIDFDETTVYANEYEKEILEHDEDDLFKIIEFKVNGCDAYLAAIYDPSKISVGVSKYIGVGGQYVYDMAKQQGAVLAINGGGFYDPNYNSNGANPLGVTIADGKIITDDAYSSNNGGIIGFDWANKLVLMRDANGKEALAAGVRDAVTMGPFLIVNGKMADIKGNGGWGYAARTAIGQRKDGIVLMLVVDSNEFRTQGASIKDLAEIMERYGAINAANLDGGTSSAMVLNGALINDPIDSALRHKTRGIPTMFKVVE
ncbi:MAG TPA: phosphodiester glycosidase family protein [Candidatus Onthocola stercoravium]|mgnify:FL=1|nr:phosphodiester glycosidase family protein [Candidatus Onthocola stercoravium]